MGRKKKENSVLNYFDESVENAIQLYNVAETDRERNRLFGIIYPALSKVSEVFYNKIKPTYIEGEPLQIQMDCIQYLSERLFRIKPGKGKGFSYLTVCARNFYIYWNQHGYKDMQKTLSLDYLNENWDIADDDTDRLEEMENSSKLMNAFLEYIEGNRDKLLNTKKSTIVLDSIVNLMKNVDTIENFNRRDMLNDLHANLPLKVDRHYITIMFNRITMHYVAFKKEWNRTGKPMAFIEKQELNQNQIDYCIQNYKPNSKKFGIIGLAREFRVEEYALRKELAKVGLCSI
jgi:hypothetical protein